MGIFKKTLSFFGTVFDIQDLTTLVRRLFGLGGTASIITGIINFLLEKMPMLSLVLIGIGIFCVLLATFPYILSFAQRQLGITPKAKPQEARVSQEFSQWVGHFDRLFVFGINTMDFRHLWNDAGSAENMEPYLLFNLVISNNTPTLVHITGCEGRATIDGDPCHYDIILQEHKPIKLESWRYQVPMLKQRLLTDKGRELVKKINDGEIIQVTLGSVNLLVEDSDGVLPNRPIVVAVSFEVNPTGITLEHSVVTKSALRLNRQ